MKNSLRLLAAFMALALFSATAFAQATVELTNELSSDITAFRNGKAYNDGESGSDADFAGIEENVIVTFTSEKVDAELDVTFILDDWNDENLGVQWDDISWYVEFRPIEMIALGFHEDIYAEGSYLPIYDDNLAPANLGSTGFTVAVMPIEGLKIAVTAPFEYDEFINYFDGRDEDGEKMMFNFGLGAEYAFGELFTIGAAVQDIIDNDERSFGVFASLKPLSEQDLVFRAGYSYSKLKDTGFDDLSISEDFGIAGENVINFSAEYSIEALSLAAEFVTNTNADDSDFDMYFAVFAQYEFTESIGANITGKFLFDLSSDGEDPVIGVNPNVFYVLGNHTFSAGLNFETCGGDTFFSIPLVWNYSF